MVIKLRTSRNKITSVEIASVTLTLSLSENGETVTSHPPTGSRDIYLKALFIVQTCVKHRCGRKRVRWMNPPQKREIALKVPE
ncbi:hypothetical protein CEXT_770791 [Caerostris extrusa]|uniref:Uncharacterized protein n=1 Tax=Caerostris extrusa TaxID=172846 RepID=A0AAV4QH84_CAEEX|nr:hypothetical protein CEXT_770791 [Caerostris extrusa]